MPEFTSKIQHKTYEKGEFSDEKTRSLSETLQLIKSFPFNDERALTAVELTGPSVTIRNEDTMEYLKVGLYFNGKYCLYYLDTDNHLYEYHAPDMDDACKIVTTFFEGTMDTQAFEKQFFSLGSRKHFENGTFTYYVNMLWAGPMLFMMFILLVIVCMGTIGIFMLKIFPLIIFYLLLDALYISSVYLMAGAYIKSKDMSLTLSRGTDVFEFGNDDEVKTYHKEDIASLIICGQSGRSSRFFNLMLIVFKDGQSIAIPGVLIDMYDFIAKFPGKQPIYKDGFWKARKALWNFIHDKPIITNN